MIDGKIHGTDCFEVELFLQRNEFSKLYQVKNNEDGRKYSMEVSPRDANSRAPVSPYVQLTKTTLSSFWVSLRFTFQTRSKFYFILDFAGGQTLSQKLNICGGKFSEPLARFYAAEIVVALEELHSFRLAYKDLDLDVVYVDSEGHIKLWRSFCGKLYWGQSECVCSLAGFCHGDPCNNNHNLTSEFDFQEDWKALGRVINTMLTGDNNYRTSENRALSVAASDLIVRLTRGDISRADQIQSHPFFKGVNWHEARMRKARPPMTTDKGSNSFPVQTNSSAGYSPTETNITNSSSSFYRPYSFSHHSDPGDTSHLKNAPDFLVPEPSLRSGFSTPDLRSISQETPFLRHHTSLPPRDMYYHYGNPSYPSTTPRDFYTSPVRRRLASRSLSDLSALNGNDDVFTPNSPSALDRTFVYPNYEPAPQYTRTLNARRGNHSGVFSGDYALRSTGSFPDLRGNVGPFTSYQYTSHNERSSPTPSMYSDYSSCTESPLRGTFIPPHQTVRSPYSIIGVSSVDNSSAMGLRRWERSSSRESENHRGISEPENSLHGNPNSLHSERSVIDNSSSPVKNPTNNSSTQQSPTQSSDFTKNNDSDRTSTNTTRERSSTLSRTLSLSDIDEGTKHTTPKVAREIRRDSLPIAVSNAREKYPLARVPIPSFREFKQRNLLEEAKNKPLIEKKDVNEKESHGSSRADPKTESKNKMEMRGKLKERLSSLYESSKDISAQNSTRKLSTSYKLNSSRDVTQEKPVVKSSVLTETKGSNTKDVKELGSSRKISKGRRESPFSKNEVIHNLMLKYGLYEKGGHKRASSSRADAKDIVSSTDEVNSREKERNNKNLKHISLATNPENVSVGEERRTRNSSHLYESTPKGSSVSDRKAPTAATFESKKSAAERFRELRRKHGMQNDSEDSRTAERAALTGRGKTSGMNTTQTASITENGKEILKREMNDSGFLDQKNSNEIRGSDHNSTGAGPRMANSNVVEGSLTVYEKTERRNVDSTETSSQRKSSIGLRGTSRAVLCATKFKRVANKGLKTSKDSPLPDKKKLGDIITTSDSATKVMADKMQNGNAMESKRGESLGKRSPNTRQRDFRANGKLRKGGIHTSMLSVASNACLTDSEVDDTVSLYSEMDSLDSERETRGRRWESFHSNISADSGSPHMFEFETDSNATEFEEEMSDDHGSEDEHPKSEAEVERTDSGVGGDMGQSPLRRSWEEIVMKSSEHWSVVAASARHWQELARRRKANEDETTSARKRSSVHSITEDMVECPDCLKHYVPSINSGEQKNRSKEPEICPKCIDRKVERKEAIIELVQTEINYGNDLQILKEEFYLPMQSGGILSPENLAAIFLNLQELLEVNSKFCAKLQKSLEESVANGDEEFSNVNVGSIFLESVDFFQAYEIYCSKQTAASALLESLQKKTELLRIFLNVTCRENPKCRKMDLNSFILAPVQRIMKYPLLLSRICKATPRRNQDREKLKMAQRRIEEQLNKINALNTAVESRQKRYRASQQLGRSDSLDKLQMKKMASDILNWTMEEMQLLMHGVFQITIHEFGASWNRRSSKKALSVCALFCVRGHSEFVRIDSDDEGECEDLLFPGEGEVTDAAVVLLRKKMSGKYTLFKEPLFLDMCVIYKECELKDTFEIVLMGKETYRFRASSSRDYRRWLKYLRLESKELGSWKRRRNGLPNIMIKNL